PRPLDQRRPRRSGPGAPRRGRRRRPSLVGRGQPGAGRVTGDGMAIVELVDIDFYYGSLQVLFGVSLAVREGEIVGLLGTNGAGKSTVLRVLSGLAPPRRGQVLLDGRDVTATPAERMAALGVVQVPGGRSVFADLTVVENLEVGAHLAPKVDRRRLVEEQLDRFP